MPVYAKVQGSTLIQFPYTVGSLHADNPYTNFGQDPDLEAIFPETESAIANGYSLVPVTYAPEPSFDPSTQNCVQNAAPTLGNGVWTLDWTISAKTMAEMTLYQAGMQAKNKAQASSLLLATDWIESPSVSSSANKPYLLNTAEFIAYRAALRAIAVDPPTTPVATWPTPPAKQWQK